VQAESPNYDVIPQELAATPLRKKNISVGLDDKISIWNCNYFVFIVRGPKIIFPLLEKRKRPAISIVLSLQVFFTLPPYWKCHSPIKQMILPWAAF